MLTIPDGRSIRLLGAESTDRKVVVKLEPVPGSNSRKFKLIAIRKADAKPVDHYGEIRVKTDSRLTPTIIIYSQGTVTGTVK